MIDDISFRNAVATAAAASDDELLERHAFKQEEDDWGRQMGGRGIVDDVFWWAVKQELERRGLPVIGIVKLS